MTFVRIAIALYFAAFSLQCLGAQDIRSEQRPQKRPNVVWLISEDNSIHYMDLFHPHGAKTPRIAELARHGILFEQAFSNSPVCSVARTTLMTSCFAPRIGTQFHRKSVVVPLPKDVRMFPEYLRRAGYYTTNNKKKDYNAVEGKEVWDVSSAKASWRNRKPGQPFFHMQSFTTTHESQLHFQDMGKPTNHDPDSQVVFPYHPNTPTFRYTHARYRDQIQKMDAQIGSVVDRLKEDGLLEDTFVFYFGDHGGVLPRGKGYAYESGLHVPLVIRVPENWKHLTPSLGSRHSQAVSFVDFGPTVLQLAGVPMPKGIDGSPIFRDAAIRPNQQAFGYADRFDEKIDLVRTLRWGRFEYVRSYLPFTFDGLQNNYRYRMLAYREWRHLYQAGKLDATQRQFFEARPAEALFDIENDPHETTNLAEDPNYAATLTKLRQQLDDQVKSMPDLSFYPESHLVDQAFDDPTGFGKQHQQTIAELVDVANLQLVDFSEARSQIEQALRSPDRWKRYWGLIVCSAHGHSAKPFVPLATELSERDEENLVRLRAAEFLAMVDGADSSKTVMDCLHASRHGVEANIVLNTLVLLRDGATRLQFQVPETLSKPQPGVAEMERRMAYLHDAD